MYSEAKSKTILVTGGAGFIGSNFIKYLLEQYDNDIRIVVLDALTYAGNLETIAAEIERSNVQFVKGDIRDNDCVQRIFADYDIDWVVNFAAESHVDRSIESPRIFLETNILGTQTLLEAAKRTWKAPYTGKKFLQISTDEVYGSLPKEWDKSHPIELGAEVARVAKSRTAMPEAYGSLFFTESTPIAPRSPYSASKASADMLVMAYHDTYGLPVNITRCSNNYGPYHFPEKLIPLVINNILQGKELPIYGKGENVRDWLYVDDHAKAILTVLAKGKVGEVYNVGGFNEESNIDIVKLIIDITARIMRTEPQYQQLLSIPVENINYDLIRFVADRPGHDMRYAINPEKLVTTLGWFPETPFTVGIERTVRWNLDNRAWVDKIVSGEYQSYYQHMYSNR